MKTLGICLCFAAFLSAGGAVAAKSAKPAVAAKSAITKVPQSPLSPKTAEIVQKSFSLLEQGQNSLRAGDPVVAELDFRSSIALGSWNGSAYSGLAEALSTQGKTEEALRVYQALMSQDSTRASSAANAVQVRMSYAAVLSQAGRWGEAVSVYKAALPNVPDDGFRSMGSQFSPDLPDPAHLQALAHVVRGLVFTSHAEPEKAMPEYQKALALVPDSGLTNFYYGNGWQHLGPAERVKFGNAAQAKAALEKAVKLGKPDVKQAAQKALLVAAKP